VGGRGRQVDSVREEAERGRQALLDVFDQYRLETVRADTDIIRRCDVLASRLDAGPALPDPASVSTAAAAAAGEAARASRRGDHGAATRAAAAAQEAMRAAAAAAERQAVDVSEQLRREMGEMARYGCMRVDEMAGYGVLRWPTKTVGGVARYDGYGCIGHLELADRKNGRVGAVCGLPSGLARRRGMAAAFGFFAHSRGEP
jgi:hypothetical protein